MGSDTAVLLVTDVTVLPGTVPVWVLREFLDKSASGKGLSIVTRASQFDEKLRVDSSSMDVLVSLAETPGHHSSAWLVEVSRILRPGGVLVVQEPLAKRDITAEEVQGLGQAASLVQTQSALQKSLLLAGFVDPTTVGVVDEVGLASGFSNVTPSSLGSQLGALFHAVALKVKKPTWETGSSFSLQKKLAVKQGVAKSNGTNGKVSLADINDFNINTAPLQMESPGK